MSKVRKQNSTFERGEVKVQVKKKLASALKKVR